MMIGFRIEKIQQSDEKYVSGAKEKLVPFIFLLRPNL